MHHPRRPCGKNMRPGLFVPTGRGLLSPCPWPGGGELQRVLCECSCEASCNILTYIYQFYINTWASGDSPLAQLVKELDLCLFLCVIRRLWVWDTAETINKISLPTNFSLPTTVFFIPIHYLRKGGIKFITVHVCWLAGFYKYYWSDLHGKKKNMRRWLLAPLTPH